MRLRHKLWAVLLLVFASSGMIQAAAAMQPNQTPPTQEAKQLRGRLSLAAGERVCASLPLHPDRAINLGQAQLTVTFSVQKKPGDDVILVLHLPKAQVTLTPTDTAVTLCGNVPALTARQHGEYDATDFAIHLGSGNVTNIGAPDDHLIDTEALAATLQALRVSFVR